MNLGIDWSTCRHYFPPQRDLARWGWPGLEGVKSVARNCDTVFQMQLPNRYNASPSVTTELTEQSKGLPDVNTCKKMICIKKTSPPWRAHQNAMLCLPNSCKKMVIMQESFRIPHRELAFVAHFEANHQGEIWKAVWDTFVEKDLC